MQFKRQFHEKAPEKNRTKRFNQFERDHHTEQ